MKNNPYTREIVKLKNEIVDKRNKINLYNIRIKKYTDKWKETNEELIVLENLLEEIRSKMCKEKVEKK